MDGTAQTLVAAEMVLLGIYGNRGGKFTYFKEGYFWKRVPFWQRLPIPLVNKPNVKQYLIIYL